MSGSGFKQTRRLPVALAIGVAAMALGIAPTHARAATPSCNFVFYEPSDDAPAPLLPTDTAQKPNLDIIEGVFGLSADGKTLRAVLYLQNQDFSFLSTEGGVGIDYQMIFTYGTNVSGQPVAWATDASLSFNPSGPPVQAFSYGLFQGLGTSTTGTLVTQYAQQGLVTGNFGSGSNAIVEVDVPLTDLTTPGGSAPPTVGSVFTGTQALSATGQGAQSQGSETISDFDPASTPAGTAFGNQYTVGQETCLSAAFGGGGGGPANGVPDAPLAGLIAIVGGAAGVVGVRLRRRRRQQGDPDGEPE
jgi:hypothetical protein